MWWWGDEKKFAVIEKIYEKLSDPKHPVSIAMAEISALPLKRLSVIIVSKYEAIKGAIRFIPKAYDK